MAKRSAYKTIEQTLLTMATRDDERSDRHFPASSDVCSGWVHVHNVHCNERDACHGPPASLPPVSLPWSIALVVPSRPRRANRSVRFLVNASNPSPSQSMDFNPLRFMPVSGLVRKKFPAHEIWLSERFRNQRENRAQRWPRGIDVH